MDATPSFPVRELTSDVERAEGKDTGGRKEQRLWLEQKV
jgi:hypothetical protein